MLDWTDIKARIRRAFSRSHITAAPPPSKTVKSRRRTWAAAIIGVFVCLCVIVLIFFNWNMMRGPLAWYAGARLHRDVRIDGNLQVTLFSWTPRAVIESLVIGQPAWAANMPSRADSMATIPRLTLALDLRALFGWHFILQEVAIEEPRLQLLRDASGRENWQFNPGGAPFRLPAIRRFTITDGRLNLIDARRGLDFLGTVAADEGSDSAGDHVLRLDGKGQLNRDVFTIDVKGDPLLNISPDRPYAFDVDIKAGATRIEGHGALDRPFDLGAFHLTATFSGADLANLYYLTGLAFPNTPPYRLTGELVRARTLWRLNDIAGTIGESDLKGALSVDDARERPYLTADLVSRRLRFTDLGALVGERPRTGAVAAASSGQKGKPSPDTTAPLVFSDEVLDVERLRQMDADVHYRADQVVSEDFPLRMAEVKLSLKDGVLRLDPASFSFARGMLAGTIQIDGRKAVPETDVDLRVTGLRLEQFFAKSNDPPTLEGTALARAKLHGSGNSIRKTAGSANGTVTVVIPSGKIRRSVAELLGINVSSALGLMLTGDHSQTDVRCAVAHFSAQDGVLTLKQFVFDTNVVLSSGEGTVDFRTEKLNLAIMGHPKAPRLIRLRAPITVTGSLSRPAIGVNPGSAILQGGFAVGLAVVLSPLAAILPFVDPGLAHDADCMSLTHEAQVQGAPLAAAPH